MGDVVQFNRGMAQRDPEQEAAQSFEARLRGFTGIVPAAHRTAVRRMLGDWTAELNPAKPKVGLKNLMDVLKNQESLSTFLQRRKRGLILPVVGDDKGSEQPLSSWNEYLAIAETLLKLLRGKRGEVAFARERRARLSALMNVAEGKGGPLALASGSEIGNLLGELADAISERIVEKTKLVELWKALERLPFTVVWQDAESAAVTPKGDDTLNEVGRMADALPFLSQSGNRPSFSAFPEDQNTDSRHIAGAIADDAIFPPPLYFGPLTGRQLQWALPRVKIGWLVNRCSDAVFVLPDQFKSLEFELQYDWFANEEFNEWWIENCGSSEPHEVAYDEVSGYGLFWNNYDFASELFAVVYPDESYELTVGFVCVSKHGPLPIIDGFDVVDFIMNSGENSWLSFYKRDGSSLGRVPDMPSDLKEKLNVSDYDIQHLEGLEIASSSYPHISFSFEMCENYQDDFARYIYGKNLTSRFYPSIATNSAAPIGGPPESVAATIIANSHAADGDQLAFIIEQQAKKIANVGLSYCSELYKYHKLKIINPNIYDD